VSRSNAGAQAQQVTAASVASREKIVLQGVSHWFADRRPGRKVHAVQDVDLVIGEREFVAVVGPSGCGKTTLLSVISGLMRPTRGSVVIDGAEVEGLRPGLIGYQEQGICTGSGFGVLSTVMIYRVRRVASG